MEKGGTHGGGGVWGGAPRQARITRQSPSCLPLSSPCAAPRYSICKAYHFAPSLRARNNKTIGLRGRSDRFPRKVSFGLMHRNRARFYSITLSARQNRQGRERPLARLVLGFVEWR